MLSIADQLLKAGLVSEEKYRKYQTEEQIEIIQPAKKPEVDSSFVNCDDLDGCKSMTEFKQGAKEILERDLSQIYVVIQKAHRFKNDTDPAAKKFIWFFYELRDRMKEIKEAKQHEALLKKAFRRRGSTFEIK